MGLITSIILLFIGGAIMIAGGELLVRGASRLASLLGIPSLVVGLTIVAACTSAPELTVSLAAIFRENVGVDVAVGNVVGSNIFNLLFILGLSAIICPIQTSSQLIKREIPLLIVISLLFWGISWITVETTGSSTRYHFPCWGGLLFLIMFLAYNIWLVLNVRATRADPLKDQISQEPTPQRKHSGIREFFISILLFAIGLAFLIYGSNQFIDGAIGIAKIAGVSELIIGLTIIAAGTSLPELVVSCIAAFRGKNDIAIGNVVGSNIFNLLCIIGVVSTIGGGLSVSTEMIVRDIPVMVVTAILGGIICITGHRVTKGEGVLLFLSYVGYVAYLIICST